MDPAPWTRSATEISKSVISNALSSRSQRCRLLHTTITPSGRWRSPTRCTTVRTPKWPTTGSVLETSTERYPRSPAVEAQFVRPDPFCGATLPISLTLYRHVAKCQR
ncbi:unnamed protein product [Leptidea sinapis]|uniref:Uncharacterized protein n=1 Tax=Leptidea sinapis TaxID=189913 RepID=A0A5E4PX80_9NEOP|nr:unnamed protein product [Leptidea sinapis]